MKKIPKKFYKKAKNKEVNVRREKELPKKENKPFFPKNFRFITEKVKKLLNWKILVIVCLCAVIAFLILDVAKLYQRFTKQRAQMQKITQEIASWQKIVGKYTDYRDGYFKLALLENQLGNKNTALSYLQKALVIDPNFQKGRELEKLLK